MVISGPIRIAVDIGGTFTDLQILDETNGWAHAHKTPTTPDDPSRGLLTGIQEAAVRHGFNLNQVAALMHGTTIATNAVLQRQLARGALITTAGFEDVLEIGRHVRRDVYAAKAEERALLIPRARRYGIRERILADGSIETPLTDDELTRIVARVRESGVEAVAVSLLHAYRNSEHEKRIERTLADAMPDLPVSLSHVLSPEIREYERTSTTVLNALLLPIIRDYISRLTDRLTEAGLTAPVFLVQSNGGVTTPTTAAAQPARLLLSGPSGGALAAETISARISEPNLIAVDMGAPVTTFRSCMAVRYGRSMTGRSTACLSAFQWSKSGPSALVVVRSLGLTIAGDCELARKAPAPSPARPAMGWAGMNRP